MKTTIIFLLIFIDLNSFGQQNWNSAEWDKESIGFGCGYSATLTKPVINVTKLLCTGSYDSIKYLLFSRIPAYQFISVFTLEKLNKKKEVLLDSNEIDQIVKIKNSENLVLVCGGCTFWDEASLKELLDPKNKHIIYASAEYWFKQYYKRK